MTVLHGGLGAFAIAFNRLEMKHDGSLERSSSEKCLVVS